MPCVINRGGYHQVPNTDTTGWPPSEKSLYYALYKLANRTGKDIFDLTAKAAMKIGDIASPETFRAAVRGLVAKDKLSAELERRTKTNGHVVYVWKFGMCCHETGLLYAEYRSEDDIDPSAYTRSYEPSSKLIEFDPSYAAKRRAAGLIDWSTVGVAVTDRYFGDELSGQDLGTGEQIHACCTIHSDTAASLSIHRQTGLWTCRGACNASGNIFTFEAMRYGLTAEQARASVCKKLGTALPSKSATRLLDDPTFREFVYTDELGQIAYKTTCVTRTLKTGKPKNSWKILGYSVKGDFYYRHMQWTRRRFLYRLRDVQAANTILYVEGESDVEAVRRLGWLDVDGLPVACTTAAGGAVAEWRPSFTRTVEKKLRHIILGDNDLPGHRRMKKIYDALLPAVGASAIRMVHLYDIQNAADWKKDVRHYLEVDKHPAGDLQGLIGLDWIPLQEGRAPVAKDEKVIPLRDVWGEIRQTGKYRGKHEALILAKQSLGQWLE